MYIDDNLLTAGEKLVLQLKGLYASCGYQSFRISKFEEYDFYSKNKDFLVSDNVLTFTDTNGKLMALKPDVTLSIIKNSEDLPQEIRKVFYNENVYRSDRNAGVFREILQTGLECFGNITQKDIIEVISLAVRSLSLIAEDSLLALCDLSLIETILDQASLSADDRAQVLTLLSQRNADGLDLLISEERVSNKTVSLLKQLLNCHGRITEVLPQLKQILNENGLCSSFTSTLSELAESETAERIIVDFAVNADLNYYNGIIFKGYVNSLSQTVVSGGQYDRLMKKLNRRSRAIGFAVYTGLIEQQRITSETDSYINVALPKGRLGENVYQLFAKAGYECPEILQDNRKLIFENSEKKIRYFWVKPADVPIYVERGAADIGVAGKDTLLEDEPNVYELLDLKTGLCKMAVAAPKGYVEDPSRTLRVASKYPGIARNYYLSKGKDIDIIKLNGSIELAPLLDLSDVIVDIVETGRTLKENNLEVTETIVPISARLIANHSSYAFRSDIINQILRDLSETVR